MISIVLEMSLPYNNVLVIISLTTGVHIVMMLEYFATVSVNYMIFNVLV